MAIVEASIKPTILVSGATGQLGKTFQHFASQWKQYDWVFCQRNDFPLDRPQEIAKTLARIHPAYCINAAAFTQVDAAETDPELAQRLNGDAVAQLVQFCNEQNSTLIHFSTDYIFDGQQSHPYTEGDAPNPINAYAKSKLSGEQAVLNHAHKGYVIRTSWLYAKAFGKNFYRTILQKAKAGEPLQVVDDQIGTPTSTDTLVAAVMEMIQTPWPYGLYHVADEEVHSWYSFAQKILQEEGITAQIQPTSTPTGATPRPRFSALGTTKKST